MVPEIKKEKIQNIASNIINGDIMNGYIVDAPPLWGFFFFITSYKAKQTVGNKQQRHITVVSGPIWAHMDNILKSFILTTQCFYVVLMA